MILLYIKAAFVFTSLITFLLITNPSLFKKAFNLAYAKVNFTRTNNNQNRK